MPTYEYECDQCGHRFEAFQRISDKPIRVCPECGKRKVRRLISSGGGIVFKGSGFYATDYRSTPATREGSGTDDSGAGKSGKADSGSGEASATDSKPKKTDSDD